MGTRGVIGLFKGGKGKITYMQYDAYPDGVGVDILREIKESSIKQIKKAFNNIKLVLDQEKQPTKEEIDRYLRYSNPSVGSQGMSNTEIFTYYQLLRNLQGTLKPYFNQEVSLMIDNEDFLKDSLFCEWGYVINLDKKVLEVWRGFTKTPQENRYKIEKTEETYFNCELLKEYPLNDLPTEDQFLKDLIGDEE